MRCDVQKACVRNGGGRIPEVCVVWPSGATNTVFPSICRAATTRWAEVIWLKVSMLWCSPNAQSRLWGARLFFLTQWRAQLGDFLRKSALQELQSEFWWTCVLIVVPLLFCSGFPFFMKANTPQDCTKASHSPWGALAFAVLWPKCAAGFRAAGDTSRAHGKEALAFRGFQERMLGNMGQLSRLWFTADCSVSELSSGSWLCLLGEPLLNNNSCYTSLPKVARKTGQNPNFQMYNWSSTEVLVHLCVWIKARVWSSSVTAAHGQWLHNPNDWKVFSRPYFWDASLK